MQPLIDLTLEELKQFKPELTKQNDFDEFWENTLKESSQYPINGEAIHYDYFMKQVKVFNVTYDGFKGNKISGWYILPLNASKHNKVPVIINYHGYSQNKG